jgi:hypothetical protein
MDFARIAGCEPHRILNRRLPKDPKTHTMMDAICDHITSLISQHTHQFPVFTVLLTSNHSQDDAALSPPSVHIRFLFEELLDGTAICFLFLKDEQEAPTVIFLRTLGRFGGRRLA